jgi:death-on-curing protein
MKKKITFLTLAEVIEIHKDQIHRYGGQSGIRDIGLLSSAVSMPHASFSGRLLYNDIYQIAAAYAFHICQNHPFIDGDKRTALASALVFLELNGISISDPEGRLYEAMVKLASGKLSREKLATILKSLSER